MKTFYSSLRIFGISLRWLFLGIILCSPLGVFGHPLDISNSSFTISGNQVIGITYFHPSQVEATIAATGIPLRSITFDDYLTHKDTLFEYLKRQTEFRDSDGNPCITGGFNAELTGIDDLFIKGFPVEYTATCAKKVDSFDYSLQIYTHLPLQTNRVSIYDGKTGNRLSYKVLTAKIDTATFRPGILEKPIDTDGDMLPDEEEKIYGTDMQNPDTDSDFYSDYEEVMYGWNPLEKRVSPGQLGRIKPRDGDVTLPEGIVQSSESSGKNSSVGDSFKPTNQDTLYSSSQDTTLLDTVTFGYYRSVLKELESIRKNGMSTQQLIVVGGILFLLGFLHALGPGHSKGFMAAYIIGSRANIFSSLQYSLLFTVIHLLDVVIMVFALKFLDGVIDMQSYIGGIMKIGVVVLAIISITLFYKSIRNIYTAEKEHAEKTESITPKSWKSGIYMAAVTGLAPCSFAWSILLILLAIGRIDLIIPLLLFFGFGVLLALSLVALSVFFLRERIYAYAPKKFDKVFPLISSIFLLFFSGIFALALFA